MNEPVSSDRPDVRRELRLVRAITLLCVVSTVFLLFMLAFAVLAPGGFLYWPAYLLPGLHLAVLWRLHSPEVSAEGLAASPKAGLSPGCVPGRVFDRPAVADDAGVYRKASRAVVQPPSVEEVRRLLRPSHRQRVPLTFRGGEP